MWLAYIHRVVTAKVYNKSSQIQSQKYKGVILPPCDYIVSPWDYIVFSNVNDNSSKIWINTEQYCAIIVSD